MTRCSTYRAPAVIVCLLFLGVFSQLSGQMMCPFPPPTPMNVDVCEGESTLIDLSSQVTMGPPFWSETFDEDGAGVAGVCSGMDASTCATNNPPSNGQWSVTGNVAGLAATDDFFQVSGGQLVAQDLDAAVCFLSEIIDISSISSADISLDIIEAGDHESADYVDVTVIIDGSPTLITNWMGLGSATHTLVGDIPDDGDFGSATVTQSGIIGNTLQIEVCFFNGAGTENFILDNVNVIDPSNQTSFNFYDANPNPGPANLIAGMVTSYDPGTTLGTSPQSVWVTTTDGMCETLATEMTVTVSDGPTVSASATSTIICEGEDIELMETGMEADSWSWTGPNGFTSMIPNPTIMGATLVNEGLYRVRGTLASTGCTDSSDIVVTVLEAPPTPTPVNLMVCEGGSTLIDLSSQALVTYSPISLIDFETPGGYTTDQMEYSDGSGDFFTRTDGSNIGGFVNYSNVQGSFYFAAMDLDEDGTNPATLFVNGVNITGAGPLDLSIFFAEDDEATNQDWDDSDYLHIDYQIDGGGFQPLIWIENDGSTFNSAPLIDTDFDGTGDGTEITDVFTEFSASIPGSGTTLDIRIEINLDSGDEDIAFDNILIREVSGMTSFNFYDADPNPGPANLLAGMATSYDPMTTVGTSPESLWVTATNGMCESTATEMVVNVEMNPMVLASATDTELCNGDDIELMETGGEADSWLWTGPNGFTSMMQNPTIMGVTVNDSGLYRVRGTNSTTGCTDSSDVVITVNIIPSAPIVEDGVFCSDALTLIEPMPGIYPPCDLFISEYIEGSGFNKCIEIYNGTGAPVDLSTYSIRLYSNGSPTISNEFTMSGMLADGEVHVVCRSNAAPEFLAQADEINNTAINWNGDDAVALANNGNNIDVIGQIGVDPGSQWSNNGVSTQNQTIVRNETVVCGDADGSDAFDPSVEFLSLGLDVSADLGSHTYNGQSPSPVLYNFYDADPDPGPANLLAGPVASYSPGGDGTFYVTAVIDGCESEAVATTVTVSQGEQPMRCNDHINISLGEECAAVLTPEMFIEGEGVMYEFLEVEIVNAAGVIIPDATLTGIHVGGTYTVKIIDVCNGNSCWSSVTLEDKLGPVFPEFCPQDQPCPVDCYTEVDDVILNVTGFLEGNLNDCTGYELLPATPIWRKASDCMIPDTLVLLFTAVDEHGNIATKEYYYIYEPIAFTAITYPMVYTGTCSTDPVPSLTGVPTIDGVPIVFSDGNNDTQVCNILGTYDDLVLPACDADCDNSRKILREFTLLDWCTSNIDVGVQVIHLKDLERPTVNPFERETVSVDPWLCEVEKYQLPLMDAVDNCTPSDQLETIVYGPVGIDILQEADGRFYAYNLPKGEHSFSFFAVDCCGNKSLVQPFILEVYDGVKPVAITKQFTVVSLSEADGDGIAKLFAESLDNGSYDNCSDVKLEIRRDGFFGRVGANDGDYTRWDSLLPPFPGFFGPYAQYPCDVIGNDTYNTDYVRNPDGSLALDFAGNPIPITNGHSWDLPSGFNRQVDPDDGQYVKFCCYDVTAATVDVNNDNILDPGYVKVWLRVWDNADMSFTPNGEPIYGTAGDHYNETWAYVKVEVGTPPVVEVTNTTISCEWPYKEKYEEGFFLEDYWIDNYVHIDGICDVDTLVTLNDDNVNDVCPGGYFELTYTISNADTKKLSSTAVQRVYIEDYNQRMECQDINWPSTYIETNCLAEGIEPELTWEAAPCDLIGWTYRSDTFMFSSDACAKIVNEFTVIDWCQWDWYYNQSGNDTDVPPTGMSVDDGGYFEGGHDYLDGVLCEEPGIDGTPDTSIPGNGVYKYVQIIKVDDDMPPEVAIKDDKMYPITNEDCFTYVTLSNTILDMSDYECPMSNFIWEVTLDWNRNGDFDDDHVYKYDRYGNFLRGLDLVMEVYDPGSTAYPKALIPFYGPMVSYDVRYVVADGCGNVGKEFINIMAVDKKPPTPYCVNLSSAVMDNGTVELWARDFDIGSFDYCTDAEFLHFTFDEVPPVAELINEEHYFDETGAITDPVEIAERYAAGEIQKWNPDQLSSAINFICDDIPSTTIAMTVWDEKGNYDYCEVTLDLIDNQGACGEDPVADIAGNITTPAGSGINEVDVLLNKEDDGTSFSEITDADGHYAFESMPMYSKYAITPSKDGDIQNGLSTEDVLLIQNFIMDASAFNSPYDVIASDLNGDGRISATDLIFLQRIIIGQTTSLKDGIWKFVDASQELTIENALTEFKSVFAIESLDQPMTSTDFIGIKMGDVNDDVITNLRSNNSSPRTLNRSVVTIVDRMVEAGEVVEVPVSFRDLNNLVGYQMTIETDHSSIIEVISGSTSLYASNIGRISEEMVALTFANILAELTDEKVFTLVVEAHQSGKLSDMVNITNGYLNSYAYHTVDVQPSLIDLEFVDVEGSEGMFSVSQNNPNPFDLITQVDFNLPYQGQVNFQVYDLNGKLIYRQTKDYSKGYNSIQLNAEDIAGNNGVYYYRLSFGDQAITRKMIMIK